MSDATSVGCVLHVARSGAVSKACQRGRDVSAWSPASLDNRGVELGARMYAQKPETAAEDGADEHQRCAPPAVSIQRRSHSHSCFDDDERARARKGKGGHGTRNGGQLAPSRARAEAVKQQARTLLNERPMADDECWLGGALGGELGSGLEGVRGRARLRPEGGGRDWAPGGRDRWERARGQQRARDLGYTPQQTGNRALEQSHACRDTY